MSFVIVLQSAHNLHTRVLRRHVQIPIDLAVVSIPLLQPLVRLLEVSTIEETLVCAQRTRMRTLQNQVLAPIHTFYPLLRRLAPSQEDNALGAFGGHGIDDFLRELFPTLAGVRISVVGADGEARIQEEHSAVGPGGEEAGVLGRRRERWVVFLEALVDVLQGWRSGRGWADGEAQAVGLA